LTARTMSSWKRMSMSNPRSAFASTHYDTMKDFDVID
jgi:hypothetical protein